MTDRPTAWPAAVALIVVLMMGLLHAWSPAIWVVVKTGDMLAATRERLPLHRQVGPVSIEVDSVEMTTVAGEISIEASVTMRAPGMNRVTDLELTSGISYRNGAIFTRNLEIAVPAIGPDDSSTRFMDRMRNGIVASAIPMAIENIEGGLSSEPIFDLRDAGVKGWVARSILDDMSIVSEGIKFHLSVSNIFTHTAGVILALIVMTVFRRRQRRP